MKRDSGDKRKSRPASQSIRFVIAECSPQHLAGVGLLIAASEKRANGCQPLPRQSILCSPICRARIAKYGHFPRIAGKGWRNFSAVQTCWRSAQSCANYSPAKFPANREKYREFAEFCHPKSHSCSLNCTFCGENTPGRRKSEQGVNRDVSGN